MGKALQPGSSLTRPSHFWQKLPKSKDNIGQQTIKPNNSNKINTRVITDQQRRSHEWCDSQTFGGIQRFEEKYISFSSSRLKHQHRLTTNALPPILSILMQGDVTIDVYIFAIVAMWLMLRIRRGGSTSRILGKVEFATFLTALPLAPLLLWKPWKQAVQITS